MALLGLGAQERFCLPPDRLARDRRDPLLPETGCVLEAAARNECGTCWTILVLLIEALVLVVILVLVHKH